jgi:murein L,D-transpeptidase YcbB/YkuD
MTIFGKSARDTFLMAALAQAGITEETVTAAQAANTLAFLGAKSPQEQALHSDLLQAREENAKLKALEASLKGTAISLGATEFSVEAITAAVEAREAAARQAGEDAATLRAASELAARGHAPVATAPAAAADGQVSSPAAKLSGLKKVEALIAEELSRQTPSKQ